MHKYVFCIFAPLFSGYIGWFFVQLSVIPFVEWFFVIILKFYQVDMPEY
jgi:hypothetical protein